MHVHTHLRAMSSSLPGFFNVVLIPLEGARPPPPPAPTPLPPIPPPPFPPCLILPHFIALLNADNWWQMDCAAYCASVALGVSGRLGAGKEGRAEREWGVLAAARRLAQVAENQYRSGLWLGLTAQEQWSVGIHWVPHTQLNWMMEQRKCRGEREGQRHVIPHYHNDRVRNGKRC